MLSHRHMAGIGLVASLAISSTALAHHGWSWAEADQITIEGPIQDIYIGPPHPVLKITYEGATWTVELGNPTQTERAGFKQGSAKVGDRVTVLGNRSQDKAETRLKAVRITVNNKTFDIYPERIKGS